MDYLGVKPTELLSGLGKGLKRESQIRIPSQQEVDIDSVPKSRGARFDLGHYQRFLRPAFVVQTEGKVGSGRLRGKEICYKKTAGVSYRSYQLFLQRRSHRSCLPQMGKQTYEKGD